MARKLTWSPLPLPLADKDKAGSWGHATGRIWYREKNLLGRSGLDRLYAASSEEEVKRLLLEHGYPQKDRALDMLAAECDQVYQLLSEITPDDGFYQILVLGRDALNLKLALKYALLVQDKDPEDFKSLMSRPALLDGDLLWRVLVGGEADMAFPRWAAEVAARARHAYGENYDAASIDRAVDRDIEAIRADLAIHLKADWISGYLDRVRDLTNFETLLRARHRKMSQALYESSLLAGGLIDHEAWVRYYHEDDQVCIDDLCNTPYKVLSAHFVSYGDEGGAALFSADRDKLLAHYLEAGVHSLSGAPRVIAYIMAREYEFKNIRLVMAAVADGLDRENIQALRRDFRKG